MSWHDPARSQEPETDAALREELRGLLGIGPRNTFELEPTAELIRLADDLRREATRRNHTARKQHSWMLMAAALPLALMLVGVGSWGFSQKTKADSLAAANSQKDATIQRLAAAAAPAAPASATPAPVLRVEDRKVAGAPKPKPKELVIPVEPSASPLTHDTTQVKGH